jgi:hypothetical protein
MDERQRRLHRRIDQIGEILRELLGQEHALVHDGPGREAGQIPVLAAVETRRADLAVGPLADDVELALEGEIVGQVFMAPDEDLPDERLAGARGVAQRGAVGRHGPPAEEVLPLGLHDLLETLLQPAAMRGIARQENQAAAVLKGTRQGDAALFAHFQQEGMRHLQEDAGAIAGVGLAAAGAAMVEVLQHLDRLLQDLVRLPPFDIDHKADATGVVLEPGIVQSLLGRQPQLSGLGAASLVASAVRIWMLRFVHNRAW